MRKFHLLAGLLLITGIGLFTSCKKDSTEDLTPSITFIGGDDYVSSNTTLAAGAEFHVGINASANASSGTKLSSFKVVSTFNNIPTTVFEATSINSDTYTWNDYVTANTVAGTERWTFTITDKDGQTTEKAFEITTEATAGEIYTYTAVLMGGQENPNHGSFYSTVDDSVMIMGIANIALNQPKVDMIYYYGTTNQASIVAPASTQISQVPAFAYILDAGNLNHWTTTNQTKFKFVTGVVWDDVTNDALITANAVGLTDMNVNQLAVIGDKSMVAFETAATSANPGKKGLFKVVAISGTTADTRQITIEVKIQK
jgi:hypothetical protein